MKFLKKYVFLQALFLTIVMFIVGMYVGIIFEDKNVDKAQSFFSQSEISLMDIVALNDLLESESVSCEIMKKANFNFADKIYEEAVLLDDFEKAGRLTDDLIFVHRKYDLLRTFLWMNAIKVKDKCGNFSTVVYLYDYEVEDLTVKAKQRVWSKVLLELKEQEKENVLLIPIARSDDFISLEALTSQFEIEQYPVVIINEKNVIYNITSSGELRQYIN